MFSSEAQLADLREKIVMVVGRPGTGKTYFARELATQLGQTGRAAFLSADMGQAAFVPGCLGASLRAPWEQADALWFVGDVTPLGNLVPAIVGAARLAEWARAQRVRSIVLDTTGLVEGPVARMLKYHKLLAVGAECVIALEQGEELEELLAVLAAAGAIIQRRRPSPLARDRTLAERQSYRQDRYRQHFAGGRLARFAWRQIVSSEWSVGRPASPPKDLCGRLLGVLDEGGFCRGLALAEAAEADGLLAFAPCGDLPPTTRLQMGRVRLDRHAGFAELR